MKKYLLIALTLLSFTLKSQIVLEHEYPDLVRSFHVDNYGYVYASGNDSIIEIRSKDHVLLKTITIGEPNFIINGFVYNVSDHLFNSDDKIEVLYALYPTGGTNPPKLIIKNEDNVVLESFDNVEIMVDFQPAVYQFDSEFKLKFLKYLPDPNSYVVDIYSLPGSTILDVPEEETQKTQSFSFPNPADNFINIRYPLGATEISVYNSNGTSIYNAPLKGSGTERISTDNYPNGCYIYKLKADQKEIGSGKFIVAK